jgi:Holliday junction resolvase RusA-like endonuclease
MKFEIPGRLPGFNEIIDAAKHGMYKYQPYAQMKETYTNMVAWLAKRLPKFEKVALIITWHEPNRHRDPDNIMAGQKFILDGLVVAGTIPNDNQRHIQGIIHRFAVDRKNPRIEVEIVDIEKNPKSFPGQDFWD